MEQQPRVSTWRIILAAVLDFITAFLVIGFIVAALTGGLVDGGFRLSGFPALLAPIGIVTYFWAFPKYLGGTLWQRILDAVR